MFKTFQAHKVYELLGAFMAFRARHAAQPQGKADIFNDIKPGHERRVLEDNATITARSLYRNAIHESCTGGGLFKTCHDIQ